MLPFQIID
jgi:hypothetical protein